jgi:RNA polymerase sigma-70 factor (ECF subfamily)
VDSVIIETFRRESGRVLASLIRRGASFDLAEDAVQEAFTVAVEVWARDGIPARPGAWITTTAKRRLIDRLRREARRQELEKVLSAVPTHPLDPAEQEDDRLQLIFTCCHPALSAETRVALTLHSVCGLATPQIAAAFLVSDVTLAQRLVRAKRKIAVAGIPFSVPQGEELGPRLGAVLATVYLVFNAGYDAVADSGRTQAGETELCGEAIRLARLLQFEMPKEPEVAGLLALMLLHDARRAARTDDDGDLILLDDQDRTRWNREQIAEGLRLVRRAAHLGPVGQYWIQAAIAAEHVAPPETGDRDWHRICALYNQYVDYSRGSPVVELNRAIAVSMAHDAATGLALLEPLHDRLATYPYFHAALADLRSRTGDRDGAAAAYRTAIRLASNDASRRSLTRALERLC